MKFVAKLSLAAALVAMPLSAFATPVFTDGVAGAGTPTLTVFSVGNLQTLGGTNVDLVGPGLYSDLCANAGADCLDLDGTTGASQGTIQSIPGFAPGGYFLSFQINGSDLNGLHDVRDITTSVTVNFGDYTHQFDLGPTDIATIVNQYVTVTGLSDHLVFTSNTPGEIGVTFDSASITAQSPEPSSLMLLGTGVLGLTGAARRRFSRS